jgi:hypothetical protein
MSYPLAFKKTPDTPSVMVSNTSPSGTGASVILTQTASDPQPSFNGSFATSYGRLNGISFNYQFLDVSQGATLTITLDSDLVFVIDTATVDTRAGRGTITLYQSFLSPGYDHTMNVALSPAPGSSGGSASASVSNLNFFYATS